MLDREERALLVVPYTPPPPPIRHLVGAGACLFAGTAGVLGLAIAEYSTTITVWLVLVATAGFVAAVGLFVTGIRSRRRFRLEMERAVEPIPVRPAGPPEAAEAI